MLVSMSIFFMVGCKKDYLYEPPPLDPNVPISFSADIVPIFTESCATSGCHDGDIDPDLTPANAWASCYAGGFVDTTDATASILYTEVLSGDMPAGEAPLTTDKISKILLWIQQGGKDN